MRYPVKPVAINADRGTRKMSIQWSDNHTSEYSFSLLRRACPCAECRGGHANMSADPDPSVFDQPDVDSPATRIRKIESVGSYAISIEWEDGHQYGIYNWLYLRRLCPCEDGRRAAIDRG